LDFIQMKSKCHFVFLEVIPVGWVIVKIHANLSIFCRLGFIKLSMLPYLYCFLISCTGRTHNAVVLEVSHVKFFFPVPFSSVFFLCVCFFPW
jgi:hypothetical protein